MTIFAAEYFLNGQIKGKITYYKHGQLTGPAIYYYDDGRIKEVGQYKNLIMIDEWKYYLPDGELEKIIRYDEKGDTLNIHNFSNRNSN